MNQNCGNVRYVLPGHRIKILATVIFGLILFLFYALAQLDETITLLDFLLIPLMILVAFGFKNFLNKYSGIGLIINDRGFFNLDETIICRMDDIESVDISPYTFKSANGFIIHLKTKHPFKAVPGLYWQAGKRVSVGGLVSKSESKFLSGTLSEFLLPGASL